MATIYVSTFAELKSAIEDTTSTEIELTSDITFSSGGAKVNTAKDSLTINLAGHKVTDNNSSSFTDTIYVPSGTTKTISVSVKNGIWSGRNYYGVVGVYDGQTNTTISFDGLNYTGPQFVYNKNGITRINDCTINLSANGSGTNPQELCEANRVYISGDVTVTSATTANAVIWFTNANSTLTVEENANFTVNALSTYFLYTDSQPTLNFKANSVTNINTLNGLFYASSSSSHIASTFTLGEGATFIATQSNSNSAPMFKCLTSFVLNENSTFRLISLGKGTTQLMYFGQRATLNFNSPKNVVLYNNGGNIFNFQTGSASSPNTISLKCEMLNLWTSATTPFASAGGILDVPTTTYHKNDYSLDVTATISLSNSAITNVESNIEDGDAGYPMTASTLKLLSSQVISMGNISITANDVTDISTTISGVTESDANVVAEFEEQSISGTASSNGVFDLPLTSQMPVGTKINLKANSYFITKEISIVSQGSVSITSLKPLNFFATTSPISVEKILRVDADWAIEVTDTRTQGENWYLYAHILSPLSHSSSTLDDCLVFNQGENDVTLSQTPILIYEGTWETPPKKTQISFSQIEGFLLKYALGKEYPAGEYVTEIFYEIVFDKK